MAMTISNSVTYLRRICIAAMACGALMGAGLGHAASNNLEVQSLTPNAELRQKSQADIPKKSTMLTAADLMRAQMQPNHELKTNQSASITADQQMALTKLTKAFGAANGVAIEQMRGVGLPSAMSVAESHTCFVISNTRTVAKEAQFIMQSGALDALQSNAVLALRTAQQCVTAEHAYTALGVFDETEHTTVAQNSLMTKVLRTMAAHDTSGAMAKAFSTTGMITMEAIARDFQTQQTGVTAEIAGASVAMALVKYYGVEPSQLLKLSEHYYANDTTQSGQDTANIYETVGNTLNANPEMVEALRSRTGDAQISDLAMQLAVKLHASVVPRPTS